MSKIRWTWRLSLRRCRSFLKENLVQTKVLFLTLCYNVHVDKYYVADTAMEPLFWVVDHFTKFFGPLFVFIVCVLTASVVLIAYVVGIPHWWQKSPLSLAILMVVGHWLLINIVFHYYMAAITKPGFLPEDILIPEAVSICKKCISPKPPRAHHCSICNKCILKMDHHCPWLNNCIGHCNHRYFFLFMIYMVCGVLFLMIFGFDILSEHIWPQEELIEESLEDQLMDLELPHDIETETNFATWMKKQYWYHMCVVYAGLLCVGVFIALGALAVWHARLISRGETSIEALINRSEVKRLRKEGKTYLNPYDFGPRENWRMFLGLRHGRTWRHILLPSRHLPLGSGLQWPTTWRP